MSHIIKQWIKANYDNIVLENQSWYQLCGAATKCMLQIKVEMQKEQRRSEEMIVLTNKLALLNFFVCLVSICQDVVLVVLHRCTVSGPLWRCCMRFFLVISKEWFVLHFYHSNFLQLLQFSQRQVRLMNEMLPNQDLLPQEFIKSKVIFHIKTHIFE